MFHAARGHADRRRHCARDSLQDHSGLVGAFSKDLVLTGKLPSSLSNALGRVLNVRLLADYDSEAIGDDDAAQAVATADMFVTAIEASLTRLGEKA